MSVKSMDLLKFCMKYYKWILLGLILTTFIIMNLNVTYKSSEGGYSLVWRPSMYGAFMAKTNRYALMAIKHEADKDPFDILYLPVTVSTWRRLNVEPILLVTYGPNTVRHAANTKFGKVIACLIKMNVNIVYLGSVESPDLIAIAESSRLFGGLLPSHIVQEEDFLISVDSHIMPVRGKSFGEGLPSGITVWNATCTQDRLCHMGMTKKAWRDLMHLNSKDYKLDGKSVRKKLVDIYGKDLGQAPGLGNAAI